MAGRRTIPIGWSGGHVGLKTPFCLPAMLASREGVADRRAISIGWTRHVELMVAMLASGGHVGLGVPPPLDV